MPVFINTDYEVICLGTTQQDDLICTIGCKERYAQALIELIDVQKNKI